MRTETTNIYTFNELSESAQAAALCRWRETHYEYDWCDEWMDSLNAFASLTGITIKDYSIGPYSHSYIKWDYCPDFDEVEYFTGLRLRAWLINNWVFSKPKYLNHAGGKAHYSKCQTEICCPFTGVCSDMALIQPIQDFITKPDNSTLYDIIESCMNGFIADYNSDMESQDSDEYIRDTIEANEYEFYSNGRMA